MGECTFQEAGNVTFDSCQTEPRNLAKTTSTNVGLNQEPFSAQSNNYFINSELNHFDQILLKHRERQTTNETIDNSALNQDLSSLNEGNETQLNLRSVPCQLLQKLQEKRVNLVLVATPLDENDAVQKLKDSLDPETYSMIPLTFDENNNTVTDYAKNIKLRNESQNLRSKKTTARQKDEKYWKRRTSNNEAARRSREAKRTHFLWIQNRTKELEVENENLKKELQSLEQKVLEQEKKAGENLSRPSDFSSDLL